MKYSSRLLTSACIAALAFSGPLSAFAAAKKAPSVTPKASASPAASTTEKMPRAIPFRGTASAVDQSAKTFTIAGKINSRVFKVTDKTTVTKAGNAATFADLTNDEAVSGSYWKHEDGTLEAKSLKIGGKTDAEKKTAADKKAKRDAKKAGADASASPAPKE